MGKTMTVSDVLYAAADRIERTGWVQFELAAAATKRSPREVLESCAVCALGAIAAVVSNGSPLAGRSAGEDELYYAASSAISLHTGAWVEGWNDQVGQTADNVVATMRRCAELLKGNAP